MQAVSIKNTLLLKTLNEFADYILNDQKDVLSTLHYHDMHGVDADEACSKEYLEKRLVKPDIQTGFPLHAVGFDINTALGKDMPEGWEDAAKKLDDGIMKAIGVGFNALKMYYPEDGYIGWHNNCNCPGQNLLLTYSQDGDGYFEWMHPDTKEIIRMQDQPGWTAKVGYYGSDKEPGKILWHTARTKKPRITVSYVVRDQSMWEYMVEDIQSDQ